MMKGVVVIPRGSIVLLQAAKVEQAGKMKGADKITLKANSIAFGGNKYEIVTTQVESKGGGEGKKTTRKVAGGAGLGAIIGGIAGGGEGAAIGAAGRRRGRRRRREPGDRTSAVAGGNADSVQSERGRDRQAVTLTCNLLPAAFR